MLSPRTSWHPSWADHLAFVEEGAGRIDQLELVLEFLDVAAGLGRAVRLTALQRGPLPRIDQSLTAPPLEGGGDAELDGQVLGRLAGQHLSPGSLGTRSNGGIARRPPWWDRPNSHKTWSTLRAQGQSPPVLVGGPRPRPGRMVFLADWTSGAICLNSEFRVRHSWPKMEFSRAPFTSRDSRIPNVGEHPEQGVDVDVALKGQVERSVNSSRCRRFSALGARCRCTRFSSGRRRCVVLLVRGYRAVPRFLVCEFGDPER